MDKDSFCHPAIGKSHPDLFLVPKRLSGEFSTHRPPEGPPRADQTPAELAVVGAGWVVGERTPAGVTRT